MAEIGRSMHKICKGIENQWKYVAVPLMDLEEQLEVPLPDNVGWDAIRTKADFVRAVVSYVMKVAPAKADAEMVARAYDQSLIRAGYAPPASDSTPLF